MIFENFENSQVLQTTAFCNAQGLGCSIEVPFVNPKWITEMNTIYILKCVYENLFSNPVTLECR